MYRVLYVGYPGSVEHMNPPKFYINIMDKVESINIL
jgi:hypothetical protein